MASLERSRASASVSVDALTTVPMPPFQSTSTGARRIARMTSFGVEHRVVDAEGGARLLGQLDALGAARPDAAALGHRGAVVVVP